MTIRNITGGPKILHVLGPVEGSTIAVTLQAGEERDDLKLSDAEAASATRTGWFDGLPKVKGVAAPVALDDMTAKQLEAYAAEKGYDISSARSKDDKLAFIKALDEAG